MDYQNVISNIVLQLETQNFTQGELVKIKNCIEDNLLFSAIEKQEKIDRIEQFIIAKRLEGKSETTLSGYELALRNLDAASVKRIEELGTDDLRSYLYNYRQERNITDRSLEQMRKIFSSFYRWLVEEKVILFNPVDRIKKIKYTAEPRTAIEPLDLEKIREACDNLRDKAIIEFLFSTGARVSEVSNAKISDINFHDKSVRILGKGEKYRTVYINARAELALQRYIESRDDDNPSLFVSLRRPHNTLQKSGIEAMVKRVAGRTDITDNIVPHKFRHTTATIAMQNGMTVQEVQKLLGHSNINTTMIYAETDDEELKIKAKKLIR